MLVVKGLTKKYLYGDQALNDVGFSIADGEQAAFLGACASGKSTLLKIIAGITESDSGSVILDGRDVTLFSPKERGIRMIFDGEGWFKLRSVYHNLKYPLKIRKFLKSEIEQITERAMARYSLSALKDEFVFRLSDSDRVRLCLARLNTFKAPLTLIDNVFSPLDAEERKRLFAELLPLIKTDAASAIFATDSAEEAFAFSDKVFFLNNGEIAECGSAEHYLTDPNTLAADKFVNAERNFVLLPVKNGNGEAYFEAWGKRFSVDTASEYVFVSYEAVNSGAGERAVNPVRLFGGFGKTYYKTEDGINVVSDSAPTAYAPDFSSFRVFDLIGENRLTYSEKT